MDMTGERRIPAPRATVVAPAVDEAPAEAATEPAPVDPLELASPPALLGYPVAGWIGGVWCLAVWFMIFKSYF